MKQSMVQEIIAQLGGKGLTGALAYTGTKEIHHVDNYTIAFRVNGKPGTTTLIHIHLNGKDLYDLHVREVRAGEIKYRNGTTDVYGDDLQFCFEELYDEYIKARNDGFINI